MIARVGPSSARSACLSIAWFVCLVQGCSKGESQWDRVAVSGTVNYAGRPVPDGSITLRPPQSPLLNALADSYQNLGESGKAREVFERSLTLNPEQPAVKERLASLSKSP